MKTICYSDDKQFYWVQELASHNSYWLSVTKFKQKPNSCGWISDVIQFINGKKSYYRHGLPFTFWKIKDRENLKEQVSDDHELVRDYEDVEQNIRNPKKYDKTKEKVVFT